MGYEKNIGAAVSGRSILDPFGKWRSLAAHLLWEQGVAGSNPAFPTTTVLVRDVGDRDANVSQCLTGNVTVHGSESHSLVPSEAGGHVPQQHVVSGREATRRCDSTCGA